MTEHTALAQISIMLGQYLIAHADEMGGQVATVAPALAGAAAVVLSFVESAPGLAMVRAAAALVLWVFRALWAAYQARKQGQ